MLSPQPFPDTSGESAAPAGDGAIRVLSWNLHGFVGRGRRPDFGRSREAILRLAPDIAAFQEVDGRTWLGREAGAFERLAAGLGAHMVEARTLRGRASGTDYGHVLWSRWPILSAEILPLAGGIEPRAAIDARVATPQGTLRVIATHLSLGPGTRQAQARRLAARLAGEAGPAILLGDLNEWCAEGAVHQALAQGLPGSARPRSWPARRPVAAMDRLYANPAVTLLGFRLDAEAAAASDHRPLICEIALQPSPAAATSRRA